MWTTEEYFSILDRGKSCVLSPNHRYRLSGPPSFLLNGYWGLSPWVSSGRMVKLTIPLALVVGEVESCVSIYVCPSSGEISAAWSCNFTLPYALMVWRGIILPRQMPECPSPKNSAFGLYEWTFFLCLLDSDNIITTCFPDIHFNIFSISIYIFQVIPFSKVSIRKFCAEILHLIVLCVPTFFYCIELSSPFIYFYLCTSYSILRL